MRLVLLAALILGTVGRTNGVIDWVAIGAAASSAIMSGSSMLHSSLSAVDYSVAIEVVIENWSKYPLTAPASFINGGQMKYPPVTVKGGQKEMFIAHKTGNTATGTYGTASWLIQDSKQKRCVVMWSAPYSFDMHSNWLGVGLTQSGYAEHKDWFDQMYSGTSGSGLNFVRGEYYYGTNTIKVNDGTYEVTGTMGTSHKTKASIVFRPLNEADVADSLKNIVKVFQKRKDMGDIGGNSNLDQALDQPDNLESVVEDRNLGRDDEHQKSVAFREWFLRLFKQQQEK